VNPWGLPDFYYPFSHFICEKAKAPCRGIAIKQYWRGAFALNERGPAIV